jgi:dihydrofolate reductase
MQMTVDGFVAGPEGQLDWMTWEMDEKLIGLINELTDSSDTILLGRKMTEGFVNYWEGVQPDSPEFTFAQKMVGMEKVVFSKTLDNVPGQNVRIENGDLAEKVNELKDHDGKDIVVYGGASFVASLIDHGLIDELNLFFNPMAISEGMRIFSGRTKLKLAKSQAYDSGIVVNTYTPAAQ